MAASAQGQRVSVSTRRGDRPAVEHHRHRWLGRTATARGSESWTSPDPLLRCAIATVNVAPIQITEIENWMWKTKKIRIRGGAPSKIRLSTPYYLLRKDVDRYLAAFDEYRQTKNSA